MKNRKISLQLIFYAQMIFWVALFVFLLFSALGRNPLSALGVALVLLAGFTLVFRMTLDGFVRRERVAEHEKSRLQTELLWLKSQMDPHFLLSTVTNVQALSQVGSEKTSAALQTLSGLLRYLLHECNVRVPLRSEIQAIESYIALLQLRYEDPLNISIDNEVRSGDMPVEPMLLIPLVENAFKHSGIGSMPGAFIRIHLREEAGLLIGHFLNSRSSPPAGGNGSNWSNGGNLRNGGAGSNGSGNGVGMGLKTIRNRLGVLQPLRPEENLVVLESAEVFEVFIRIRPASPS